MLCDQRQSVLHFRSQAVGTETRDPMTCCTAKPRPWVSKRVEMNPVCLVVGKGGRIVSEGSARSVTASRPSGGTSPLGALQGTRTVERQPSIRLAFAKRSFQCIFGPRGAMVSAVRLGEQDDDSVQVSD